MKHEKGWDKSKVYLSLFQGRHYMAVMDLDFCWFACLFGNNENDYVQRIVERDRDIEQDIIAEESHFWNDYVLARVEPPYTEDGDLVLESIRKHYGPAVKGQPAVLIPAVHQKDLEKIMELRAKKSDLDKQVKELDSTIKQLYGPIIDRMGTRCIAECKGAGVLYRITYNPRYRTGISADSLKKLEVNEKSIYDEYVTTTESRVFAVKKEGA